MEFVYRGLQGTLQRHQITEEELDRQLLRLQQQTPKVRKITDRAAQMGDELLLDYAGFCGGEQFEGGTAEKQTLTLGSGAFIPGFEAQLVGAHPGERVNVRVTFPAEYHAPALAGKEAEFRCLVHEIREKGTYELNDEFARAVGPCETVGELREMLRQGMQEYADGQAERELQDQLLRKASATLGYTPTEQEIDRAVDEQMKALEQQLAQQNLTLEMYSEFTGRPEAQLRADAREDAAATLRMQAAVEKIAEIERIGAEDQDLADAYAAICRQNHITMEQLRPHCDEAFAAAVEENIVAEKVLRLIREAAVVSEE